MLIFMAAEPQNNDPPPHAARAEHGAAHPEIDLALLEESLAKTPWERMQANDDALRFADALRAAMEKRNAKP